MEHHALYTHQPTPVNNRLFILSVSECPVKEATLLFSRTNSNFSSFPNFFLSEHKQVQNTCNVFILFTMIESLNYIQLYTKCDDALTNRPWLFWYRRTHLSNGSTNQIYVKPRGSPTHLSALVAWGWAVGCGSGEAAGGHFCCLEWMPPQEWLRQYKSWRLFLLAFFS